MKKTKLFTYQKEGAQFIRKFKGRAILADQMGLGKTIQALYWCYKMKKARPIVIVCPASLKYNWEREISKHCHMMSTVIEGQKPPTRKIIEYHHPFIIINYDILPYWLDHLKKQDIKGVILDECHYIKNRSTKRYKAVKALCKGKKYLICLSGTPLTNRPAELWPVLNLVRPDIYPSFLKFAFQYCRPRKLRWGWVYDGAINLKELHQTLRSTCMIRRLKKDVLKELPAKARRVITIPLSNPKEYAKAERDIIKWLAEKDLTKAKKAKKAKELAKLGYLKRLAAQLKVEACRKWIDNFLEQTDEKLVVIGVHHSIIDPLYENYYHKSVIVHGGVTGKKRMEAVDLFQKDPNVRLFFGNIQAAGTGLTLTAASKLVFLELDWIPANHSQAEDRIHRIGQTMPATIYYLISKGTIESHLCEIIRKKQEIIDEVLDGKSSDELDILSLEDTNFDVVKELKPLLQKKR